MGNGVRGRQSKAFSSNRDGNGKREGRSRQFVVIGGCVELFGVSRIGVRRD